MSSLIPIESDQFVVLVKSLQDQRDQLLKENKVLKDNFAEAMTLYNKSEDERKQAEKTNEILRRTLNHKDEMLEFLR
jgi:hydroxymethylpyrimidine/phosphomethylpyrimidine kinase